MQQANIGMIGGGTVGGGVVNALRANGNLLSARIGVRVNLARVAVRSLKKSRAFPASAKLLTTDWKSVITDPGIDIVVELVGGTTLARTMILDALRQGKPVITANKALLSKHGEELFAAAARYGVNLYYEASVCGGIPIIKALREGLVGNRIQSIYGIVNGTCNYILSRMKHEEAGFEKVLSEAQAHGYAETPPDLDVDGYDALHKVGILASLAHGFWVNPKHIYVEGIRSITQADIQFAHQFGYTIKLLGIIKNSGPKSRIQASVYPTLIPDSHVLASVEHVFNAVFVRSDIAGDELFYGRGAGADATASAVVSDIADAALDLKSGAKRRVPPFVPHEEDGSVVPIGEVVSRYFVRFNVVDRPGTLAKIAAILGKSNIGILSVLQPEAHEGENVPLIMMLHDAPNAAVEKALKQIAKLPVLKGRPVMLRVEDFE